MLRQLLARLRSKGSAIPRVPASIPQVWAEANVLHRTYGGPTMGTPYTDPELPEGWAIAVRQWSEQAFDALIFPPAPKTGWRLAGAFARTDNDAYRRAREEIFNHVRGTL